MRNCYTIVSNLKPDPFVAHGVPSGPLRAASALVPTLGLPPAAAHRASVSPETISPLPPASVPVDNRMDYNRTDPFTEISNLRKNPALAPHLRVSALTTSLTH
jgi:hypothetical protein